ncbi:hypothetical protein H257_09185 [Aphanomyces astaci]|uniref:Purple acid phosphatase n=1 Tax=Aphanomyces astaci TaxID=112090 RepID=W4GAL8_APHAT|nr:hypothetical protein H257_09185 [Aphanomyces astaci]ETV76710.1 hypothetical protein H257_09185 [Aphanomyces astaci]|eukprot:XP_009833622.1 hypothetical protein H257_09185 [Aphanomyces astaci]
MVKIAAFTAIATTAAVAAKSVTQVHLALTNRAIECAHGVSVNFASDSQDPFTVTFNSTEGNQKKVDTVSSKYSVTNTASIYTSPFLHSANLCNLNAATTYSYNVGGLFSSTFVSPPGSSATPTVIGLVGDADLEEGSFANLQQPVQNLTTQAILIVGDYSYANGNHKKWDKWYDLQQPIFSKMAQAGVNGNHEVIQGSKGYAKEYYLGYLNRAATPITPDNAKNFRTYYSINFGLVHLVFLDDYVGARFRIGSTEWRGERQAQVDWLTTDLAQVDRTSTPYVVVLKHNPYYNTYSDHQCQCSPTIYAIDNKEACWNGIYTVATAKREPQCGLQAKLEDIYAANKVDVVFSGHVHGYERSDYVYQNKVNKDVGSVYITTGAGGRGHAHTQVLNVPSWHVYNNPSEFGASRLIATREKMQVLWHTNTDTTKAADAVDIYPRLNAACITKG